MGLNLRTPGGERTTNAILTSVWGGLLCYLGYGFWSRETLGMAGWFLLVLGLPLLAAGVLLWFRRSWARWPAVVIFGFLAAGQAWGWIAHGFDLWRTFLLGALAWTGYDVFRHFSPRALARAEAADAMARAGGEPMISLVLLLRRPRFLDPNGLARYADDAWGGTYSVLAEGSEALNPRSEPEPRWVGGRSPIFFVWTPDGLFMVHNHDQPYFENTAELARRIPDLRLRRMLEDNRAWMAVDLMAPRDPARSRESFYPAVARLIAALAGPDCQAIYRPETQEFNHWDESLEEKLRGSDVLSLFTEPTRLPVIEVPDNDPRMKEAVAEARRRWPEFVEAYRSGQGELFSVKAPICAGENTEFIWIQVDQLDPENIRGRLGNDPVDLEGLQEGSPVSVPVSQVNDWAFLRDGQPQGMFTVKVLQAVQEEARLKPPSP